ncbi:hypothetical protein DHD80_04980 [Gramella sp. AN32]|nr:hypothetical protein [Gramella sp. AN32]
MFLKFSLKALFIIVEIFLGIYSLIMSDSLLVKFAFFVLTAGIIAFIVVKFIHKVLPVDNDYLNSEN